MTVPVALRYRAYLSGCLAFVLTVPLFAGAPTASPSGSSVGAINPRPPQLCFAPGTPVEVVEAVDTLTATWGGRDAYQFPDTARWSSTAYQPDGNLAQGDPTTLSWSIIPDGTSIAAFNPSLGESNDPSDLIAFLDGIYGGSNESDLQMKPWFSIFENVFARWGELTGNTYIYEANDDGRRLGLISWPGVVGVRGDIRVGGHAIDGNSGVLAYNFYPDVGNMVFDTSDNFYENTSNDSHRLRQVTLHEHGHGLGIAHVCPVNETKLMEPFYSDMFLGPQFDDILAGQRGYGDPNEPNDDDGEATDLGALGNGSYGVSGAGIDDEGDSDWYRVELTAGRRLSVTVSPVGSSYLSGPQNLNGSCSAGEMFDALAEQDLGVEIIWTDGGSVLAAADETEAGEAETIANLNLGASAGAYYIRVYGTTPDKVQMYDLDFDVATALPTLPKFIGASSRKLHGQEGDTVEYDLPLALSGDPTVEPRQGGVDRIILKFSSPVSLSCADVSLTTAACGAVTDLGGGLIWELGLTGVASNECETLTLLASLGLGVTSPKSVRMVNVFGDVNQSGNVSLVDLAYVKSGIIGKARGTVDETNFLQDVQLSNSINIADLSAVKSNFGASASCTP